MSYSGMGRLIAIGFVGIVSDYTFLERKLNNTAVEATVYNIERTCKYTQYFDDVDGNRVVLDSNVKRGCSSTFDFQRVASDYRHREKDLDGEAVVTVRYALPENTGYYLSDLKFTGRDDEFYTLHDGDKINILVSNDDPTKIRQN